MENRLHRQLSAGFVRFDVCGATDPTGAMQRYEALIAKCLLTLANRAEAATEHALRYPFT